MNENNYVLHAKNGVVLVTESQAINNALDQEKSGVIPRYSFLDYKTGENLTPPVRRVFLFLLFHYNF